MTAARPAFRPAARRAADVSHAPGRQSLYARAISTLRRTGGLMLEVPDNFGGVYIESIGVTPVTAVSDVIGLTLDSARVVGPEIAPLTATWGLGTGITQNTGAGTMTFTAAPSGQFAMRGNDLRAGGTYQLEFTVASISGGTITMLVSGGDGTVSASAPGTYRAIVKAVSVGGPYLWVNTAATTAVITSASCKEITGAHATQSSTFLKPTVTRVPKRLGPELSSLVGSTVTSSVHGSDIAGFQVGKTYRVQATVNKTSGTSIDVGVTNTAYGWQSGGVVAVVANGVSNLSFTFVASDAVARPSIIFTSSVGSVTVTSVQEVLEWTNAMSFDGSNDHLVTGLFTGTSGTLVAACTPNAFGPGWTMLIANGAQVGIHQGVRFGIDDTGRPVFGVSDGTGTSYITSGVIPLNTPCVISAMWNPAGFRLRTNGGTWAATPGLPAAASLQPAYIGAANYNGAPGDYFQGAIHTIEYSPTYCNDADVRVLEERAAQKAGVTLS